MTVTEWRRRLTQVGRHYQASWEGMALYQMLSGNYGYQVSSTDERSLKTLFSRTIEELGFSDLLEHQVEYVVRLSQHPGKLEYEEMSKLFSLANEVYALQQLRSTPSIELSDQCDAALRDRFQRQTGLAKAVAVARVEPWSASLWWFSEFTG